MSVEWDINQIINQNLRKDAAFNAKRLAVFIRPLLRHADLPDSRTLDAFVQVIINHTPKDKSLVDVLKDAFLLGAAWQKGCLLSEEEMVKIMESYEHSEDLDKALEDLDEEENKT